MIRVAIIILNWNQKDLTLGAINSVLKISSRKFTYDLLIVDNGSTDNSVDSFKKYLSNNKNSTILETGSNLGYVGGNNFGLKYAFQQKYDFYCILNNDTYVKSDFLDRLLENHADITGPKIYFAPGHEYYHDRYQNNQRGKVIWSAGGHIDWANIIGSNIGIDEVDQGQYDTSTSPDFISGCCLLITHQVLLKIGFLDERYYLYLEDADFCQRAKKSGFKLLYQPSSVIWHINAGSTSPGSQIHNYFLTRNRILFAMLYAPFRTKLAIIRESFKVLLLDPSKWRKIGVLDYYFNRFGKGSWK